MPQGKEFVIQQLNNALAVEQAIAENEQTLAGQVSAPELREALQQMASQDQGHVANFQRVLQAMGGRPQGADPDTQQLVSLLRQGSQSAQEELNRLVAHGLLKHKAVSGGKVFHALSEELGNPQSMSPLDVNLQEDLEHEQQLSQFAIKLAQQQAMSGTGAQDLRQTLTA